MNLKLSLQMLIFVHLFLNQNVLIQVLIQHGDLNEEENLTRNLNLMIKSKSVLGIWIQNSIVQSDGQKSSTKSIVTYQMIKTLSDRLHPDHQRNQKLDLRNLKVNLRNRK